MTLIISSDDLAVEPLSRASTLPSRWYFDQRMFEVERDVLFGRSWQLVGHSDQVRERGMYFTCEVASEPLIVARGLDGVLRAFSNVCRHKAALVASGEGACEVFKCPYHGWTYSNDGSLRGVPFFRGVEGFRREDNGLPQFRVEELGPLVFVNLDPGAPPLGDVLVEFIARFAHYRLSDLSFEFQQVYELECNWKVVVENTIECYHCPSVHPTTVCAATDVQTQRTVAQGPDWIVWTFDSIDMAEHAETPVDELDTKYSVTKSTRILPVREGLEGRDRTCPYSVLFFPNTHLSLAPNHMVASRYEPVGPERCVMVRDYYFEDASDPQYEPVKHAIAQGRDEVVLEDVAICGIVQRGLHSRTFSRGRLSVEKDYQTHVFENWYRGIVAQHGLDSARPDDGQGSLA